MTCRIFISYRRKDTAGFAHAIYNLLAPEFGPENVFMDVDTIEPGQDFVETLNRAVGICDVLLVLIGPMWLDIPNESGTRRLDDPNDFVRLEIASALKQKKIVIPVLFQDAGMPPEADLPADLGSLSRRQAVQIGDHFTDDVKRLIASIRRAMQAEDGTVTTSRTRKLGETGQEPFTSRREKASKSARNLFILSAIVIGICLISGTTLAIIFGPKFIASFSGEHETPTQFVLTTSTSALMELPTTTTEASTDVPTASTTSVTIKEPTHTKSPSLTPTEPNQPKWGFQDNCIDSETWTFYPNPGLGTNNNGCLLISNMGFNTHDQSLLMNVLNPTSNDRIGIYAPIPSNSAIEFDIKIEQLTTANDNELGSLGFGVISTQPFNTETDGFLFYVIESSKTGYPVFLKKAERGINPREPYIVIDGEEYRYKLGTKQRVSFLLQGNQLMIYIDGRFVRDAKLTFGDRAFFIGYKFENLGSLNAQLSNLSIVEK